MSVDAEFRERRLRGIGGSDAPCVLGMGRKSPLELWGIKTGEIEEDDIDDEEYVIFGKLLEGVIADEYQRRTGATVTRLSGQWISKDASAPFMICHPDGRIASPSRATAGVAEFKTTTAYLAHEWQDEPPLPVQIQLTHNMLVVGATWGAAICLIGGQRLVWQELDLNDRFAAALVEREREFWGYVERREPPPLSDLVEADARALAKLYGKVGDEGHVALPPELAEWDLVREAAIRDAKDAERRRVEAENQIKAALGSHAIGYLRDGTCFSWKEQSRKEYTVAAATYRVLRRHESKLVKAQRAITKREAV